MKALTEDQLTSFAALGDDFWHAFSDLRNDPSTRLHTKAFQQITQKCIWAKKQAFMAGD